MKNLVNYIDDYMDDDLTESLKKRNCSKNTIKSMKKCNNIDVEAKYNYFKLKNNKKNKYKY